MKINLYGGYGYVGSILAEKLLQQNHELVIYDNFWQPPDSVYHLFNYPNLKCKYLDITDEQQVKEASKDNCDILFLLSGIVGVPACKDFPVLAKAVNDIGWSYVCRYKNPKTKIISANTGSVYGQVLNGLCSEDITPTEPLSHYGITKLAGEKHVLEVGGISTRAATAAGYSARMRLNLLPNELCYDAINRKYLVLFEPDNMRTFIDVRDFADALIHLAYEYKNLKYQIYNLGDNRNNRSKRQLGEYIKSKTNCKVIYYDFDKDTDARNYQVNYNRIEETGFRCRFLIEDTIDNLLDKMKSVKVNHQYWR